MNSRKNLDNLFKKVSSTSYSIAHKITPALQLIYYPYTLKEIPLPAKIRKLYLKK